MIPEVAAATHAPATSSVANEQQQTHSSEHPHITKSQVTNSYELKLLITYIEYYQTPRHANKLYEFPR